MYARRKSQRMLATEVRFNQPLETLIPQLINELGSQSAVADQLSISRATLCYWLLKLGVTVARVAVNDTQAVTVGAAK